MKRVLIVAYYFPPITTNVGNNETWQAILESLDPLSRLDDYNILLSQPKVPLTELGVNDYCFPKRYESSVFDFSPTFFSMYWCLAVDAKMCTDKLARRSLAASGAVIALHPER